MAQAAKTKEEIIRESMNSPKIIDTTVNFKIPRSSEQFDPSKHKYKCSCCGKGYNSLKNILNGVLAEKENLLVVNHMLQNVLYF